MVARNRKFCRKVLTSLKYYVFLNFLLFLILGSTHDLLNYEDGSDLGIEKSLKWSRMSNSNSYFFRIAIEIGPTSYLTID